MTSLIFCDAKVTGGGRFLRIERDREKRAKIASAALRAS